ncbi:abscisic acid 8'-hydroxylase CYP707A1-like isoform X4 [Pistacia vera]|uniref:abscisic acid 8'-hydroxylase CYP707A1-like isoform X1 n=1 Tax=Pistacia vera TaxID=55513 RepID=UPI0012635FE7|nr:abscisic acid 8'-hydroxylase CYP707A1-like isoform X1 [Pistacia vera]XP_031267208.1 abscisic acid 8'-hydroxylase CYP707A1-like isoform X4 [Pistacia vera]
MVGSLVFVFIFLFSLTSYLSLRREKREPQRRAKLPPGSMGWPFIGETLQLYSQDPNVFFASKQKRYGEIFKTHILGCPCVMLASPEAARFVLVTQSRLFKPTYPKSKERLIGPSALFYHQGDYHLRLRKLVKGSLSLNAIRNLVSHIETAAVSALDSWDGGRVINTFQEMKKFSFEVGILAIFGHLKDHYKEELKKNYCILDKGYNSFPTNIPGTPYKKALLARKRLSQILSDIIRERKENGLVEKDLLGCLLNSKNEKGEALTDDKIADNTIGVLFAAQDTTASALTWIVKYLHDNPKLLETVKAEQKAIHKLNEEGKQPLSWSQTRKMPVTTKVILESLRMASIISFTFREAVADVEYKGYLIPKGWKVMPLFRNIHHNPEFFPDPQKFDPSRFEVAQKPNTFTPFGSGVHSCPGNELAKLEMLVMTHHLVSKFRWEVIGSKNGIQYGPFPIPQQGLPARFWKEFTSRKESRVPTHSRF